MKMPKIPGGKYWIYGGVALVSMGVIYVIWRRNKAGQAAPKASTAVAPNTQAGVGSPFVTTPYYPTVLGDNSGTPPPAVKSCPPGYYLDPVSGACSPDVFGSALEQVLCALNGGAWTNGTCVMPVGNGGGGGGGGGGEGASKCPEGMFWMADLGICSVVEPAISPMKSAESLACAATGGRWDETRGICVSTSGVRRGGAVAQTAISGVNHADFLNTDIFDSGFKNFENAKQAAGGLLAMISPGPGPL